MDNGPVVLKEQVKMLENELRASNQRLEEIVDGISREVDNSGEILCHM